MKQPTFYMTRASGVLYCIYPNGGAQYYSSYTGTWIRSFFEGRSFRTTLNNLNCVQKPKKLIKIGY